MQVVSGPLTLWEEIVEESLPFFFFLFPFSRGKIFKGREGDLFSKGKVAGKEAIYLRRIKWLQYCILCYEVSTLPSSVRDPIVP